jgi:WD40 repeat protein
MGYVPASLTLTPDGSCYAVLEKEGEHRLLGLGPSGEFRWAIDADARGLGCTDGDDRQDADLVAASPDGKRLALSGGLLLDADGKFVDYLLPLIPREHAYALSEPAWSPNGQQLAYIASGPAKGDQVVIFDLAARTSRFLPLSLKRQSRTNMLYPDTGLAWHPVTGQLAATGLGDDGETVQVALFDQAGVRQQAFSVAASPEQSRTGSTFQVLQLIFTPGGKNLEVVSTDRITAIDLENGAQRTVVSVNQLPRNKPIYAPVY